MSTLQPLGLFDHLTHKANLKHTRYGWLRLTPAYSVHLVSEILDTLPDKHPIVLDPFCGTGTTALVCAEKGIPCDTTDINPFLLWLTRTKTRTYTQAEVECFEQCACRVAEALCTNASKPSWLPSLHQIEKWWDMDTLQSLSLAFQMIIALEGQVSEAVADLLKIAFCRLMIERANVSFGHQSMSFKASENRQLSLSWAEHENREVWREATTAISRAARSRLLTEPRIFLCDARTLSEKLEGSHYSCVITSPPYPNRMSYIRELRPYMYWLGYLETAKDASELDWQAIGGTWGSATSKVGKWKPEESIEIPYCGFTQILESIAETSPLLSRYVHKYFYDMTFHIKTLRTVLKPGASVHYIVGNSKFYDVMLPVEEIYAALFRDANFVEVEIRAIRKRTSKKELFEFIVSAKAP